MDSVTSRPTAASARGTAAGHWGPPDIGGDILSAALQPDLPEPAVVHIHPTLHARLLADRGRAAAPDRLAGDVSGQASVIPLVVDDGIPSAPGYEIHRVA